MLSDFEPRVPNPVPTTPSEWDEIFINLEAVIALSPKAGAPGSLLGVLPPEREYGQDD